jgi:hypothetical protein
VVVVEVVSMVWDRWKAYIKVIEEALALLLVIDAG